MRTRTTILLACGLASALALGGCASGKGGAVPESYLTGTTLDRNPIRVSEKTEYLEVQINPLDPHLRLAEKAKIRDFVADYKRRGHGPLMMSMPENQENQELTIKAVAEAREIAWSHGVEYEEISGSAYDARGEATAPLVLAFRAYDAIAPDCPQKSAFDFADATSNNDMPSLGCSVRTNMAAMIADPSDLLGERALEEGDLERRSNQLELYRQGQSTAAERSQDESAALSDAVN